ncbi:Pycsar system effector family protein [Micromonospora sp. NPDC000207]|uniref:Pycsar system effector family protein n=1 Tax=Micromonospora sp. NPDC000207 TaxID=3154246 RepID=UPI00331E14A0
MHESPPPQLATRRRVDTARRHPAADASRSRQHLHLRRDPSVSADPAAIRLAERLLSEVRDELRRADARATQWLTMFGGGLLALLTLLTGTDWSLEQLALGRLWLWWSGCAAATLALTALVMVLVPRTGGPPDARQVAYFGHVARLRDPDIVGRHVASAARNSLPGLIAELCWLSQLAMTKYRWIRIGTVLTAFSVASIAASLL